MNRLWVRLSLAFCGVVFFSFIAVTTISFLMIRSNLEQYGLRTYEELAAAMSRFYQEQGSWDGIDAFLEGVESVFRFRPEASYTIRLIDAEDHLIYSSSADGETETIHAFPIMVEGETAGVLHLGDVKPSSGGVGARVLLRPPLEMEQTVLMLIFVGSSIGILFGVLMSRTLTAPLADLTQAAEAIGAGEWNRRVQIDGTAETASLARSFNAMIEKLHHTETLRRNMVADVAHELRTPITALQANIYAILDDAYPMTKTEIAGLYEQTRMLSRLVSDLHELSQAEARQLRLDRVPVDFSRVLPEFVAPFRPVAESKGVRLELTVPPALPAVPVDVERINQVLHNLLSNALRHTPSGGIIHIEASGTEHGVRIAVRDTGDGITAEHLPNIFERFYRADFARSRQAGGTGLGLAIARAIVQAHDGQINVTSAGVHGEGTTFTVELPVLAARDTAYTRLVPTPG